MARSNLRQYLPQMHIAGHKVDARPAVCCDRSSNRVRPITAAFKSSTSRPSTAGHILSSKKTLCGCLTSRAHSRSVSRSVSCCSSKSAYDSTFSWAVSWHAVFLPHEGKLESVLPGIRILSGAQQKFQAMNLQLQGYAAFCRLRAITCNA